MAKTFYKFPLPFHGKAAIVMPAGAEVRHVAEQNSVPQLWALVDTRQEATEQRCFYVAQTGEELPDFRSHIGTLLIGVGGEYVVHVMELPR